MRTYIIKADALDRLAESIENNAAIVAERLQQSANELREKGKKTEWFLFALLVVYLI